MATAFISGSIGRAVLAGDDSLIVIEKHLTPRPATHSDIEAITNPAFGFRKFDVADDRQVRELLESEARLSNILFLLLSILDRDLSIGARLKCCAAVEQVLDDSTVKRVEAELLKAPLPSVVRANWKQLRSIFGEFPKVSSSLDASFSFQEDIDTVAALVDSALRHLPDTVRTDVKARILNEGFFSSAVLASRKSDEQSFNGAFVSILIGAQIGHLGNETKMALVELRKNISRVYFGGRKSSQRNSGKVVQAKVSRNKSLEELVVSEFNDYANALSIFEIKTRVDKQIAAIKEQLFLGRQDLVEKYSAELVQFQLQSGAAIYIGMSLCALATSAVAANQLDIADRLSLAATKLGVDDPVIFTTRAEILKDLGKLEAALRAYRDAHQRFPNSRYARNGLADVLKELGQYEESMSVYAETQMIFPDDSVAFNGLISTLRAKGDIKRALIEAKHVLGKFESDSFSAATYASLLSGMGRFKDAVKNYRLALELSRGDSSRVIRGYRNTLNRMGDQKAALGLITKALSRDRNNLALRNLLATQCALMNKPEAATKIVQEILLKNPGYSPALLTLGVVKLISGNVDESLILLEKIDPRSEVDWHSYRIYLVALFDNGEFVSVRDNCLRAIDSCPWIPLRNRFRVIYAMAESRLGNAAVAVKELERGFETLDIQQKDIRLVLLSSVRASNGQYDVAQSILNRMIVGKDERVLAFRQYPMQVQVPRSVMLQIMLAAA